MAVACSQLSTVALAVSEASLCIPTRFQSSCFPIHLSDGGGKLLLCSHTLTYTMHRFNSVVLENLSSNEFSILVVNDEFLLGGFWSVNSTIGIPYRGIQHLQDHVNDNKTFERLSNSECINNYGANYIFGRRNLLAVTRDHGSASAPNSSILSFRRILPDSSAYGQPDTSTYGQPDSLTYDQLMFDNPLANFTGNPSTLLIDGHPVDYCLSEIVPEKCKLQFSLEIMIIVIVCNVIKIVCFVYTLWKQKDDSLTTIG